MNAAADGSYELTAWISGAVRPLYEGVYERRVSDGPFSCWNGRSWNRDAGVPSDAAGAVEPSRDQNASWRGLKSASSLPCATCKGHTVIDGGFDPETDADLLGECPDC